MIGEIEAIFLDLGNTLRMLVEDESFMDQARKKIVELLGSDQDPIAFQKKLETRYREYRKWAFENLEEAPESELWTIWLAPEFPAEKVAPLSEELTYQFRKTKGRRVLVEGGRQVIDSLYNRGYILGIISNLIGRREIPEWLQTDGFIRYFKSVLLSCEFGRRKPHPSIYLEAARRAEVEPKNCAYVGDNLERDVAGTRAAGFGMVILFLQPGELVNAVINDENRPDRVIHEFHELLEIFPDRAN
jgi:HAD superfamily hydrolase (TIGR01549 family)